MFKVTKRRDVMSKCLFNVLYIIVSLAISFIPMNMAIAGQLWDSGIQVAAADSPPGSKDPEGLEQEPGSILSVGWDVTIASKYLFQGTDISEGKPVIQPEAILTVKGFSAILWFNYDLHTSKSNEFDLYLQYDIERENLTLTSGYAHYNYPHRGGWEPSQEVFMNISYSAPLNPSLSIHYDFDAGKGSYYTFNINRDTASMIGELSLGMNLFYQSNYYESTGFPSVEFNISTEYPVRSFTISPSVSYFITWDNADFSGDSSVPDTWLFSLNIGQSF